MGVEIEKKMSRICGECPIRKECENNPERYKEGWSNGLFLQAIQSLSAPMMRRVKGTKNGLSEEGIEGVRVEAVGTWGSGTEEAEYLETNPDIATMVHDCELEIQLGGCAIHSAKSS